MSDEELTKLEIVLLTDMGAAEALGVMPVSTLKVLYPEAFPLSDELRSLLLKNECLTVNAELTRFVYGISAVYNDAQKNNASDIWEDDPFFQAFSGLNIKHVKTYLRLDNTAIRDLARLEQLGLLSAEFNETIKLIVNCFPSSGRHLSSPKWNPVRDNQVSLIYTFLVALFLLSFAEYEKSSFTDIRLKWCRRGIREPSEEAIRLLNQTIATHYPHLIHNRVQDS